MNKRAIKMDNAIETIRRDIVDLLGTPTSKNSEFKVTTRANKDPEVRVFVDLVSPEFEKVPFNSRNLDAGSPEEKFINSVVFNIRRAKNLIIKYLKGAGLRVVDSYVAADDDYAPGLEEPFAWVDFVFKEKPSKNFQIKTAYVLGYLIATKELTESKMS